MEEFLALLLLSVSLRFVNSKAKFAKMGYVKKKCRLFFLEMFDEMKIK